MRVAFYARISTHDQHTLAMQMDAMHEFATRRGWTVIDTVEEIASGAKDSRPKHQALLKAAKQRKLDVILVWKLDRWGRSLKAHGRPRAKANDAAQIRTLAQQGLSQAAIARHLGLWRTRCGGCWHSRRGRESQGPCW
jgi:DNA invertase Pin-like site-specific DNA recombinase